MRPARSGNFSQSHNILTGSAYPVNEKVQTACTLRYSISLRIGCGSDTYIRNYRNQIAVIFLRMTKSKTVFQYCSYSNQTVLPFLKD